MPEKLQLVDADTLLSTPMEKTMFVVEGLIPQGVSMLCGSGKIGTNHYKAPSFGFVSLNKPTQRRNCDMRSRRCM